MSQCQYRLSKQCSSLCDYPAQIEGGSLSILGQPQEISFLIGTFLAPIDLAQAQRVSLSWYRTFGQERLWIRHLPLPIVAHLPLPAKVEVIRQLLLRECWQNGEVKLKKVKMDYYSSQTIKGGVIAPDESWILTFGCYGNVFLWKGFRGKTPTLMYLAGDRTLLDPHRSHEVNAGMVSPDGRFAFTLGENGYIARWSGFGTTRVTGSLISTALDISSPTLHDGAMSPNGTWAFTVGNFGRVSKWMMLDGETPTERILAGTGATSDPHQFNTVRACSISPDGTWAITVGDHQTITRWTGCDTDMIIATPLRSPLHVSQPFRDVCISPEGTCAFTVGHRFLKWKDLHSKKPNTTFLGLTDGHSLSLSMDGTWALTTIEDRNALFVMNTSDGKAKRIVISNLENVVDILISPFSTSAVIVTETELFLLLPKLTLEQLILTE